MYMPDGDTATGEPPILPAILKEQRTWQIILNWTCAILIAIVFLKERATAARLVSAALIGAGAAVLVLSG